MDRHGTKPLMDKRLPGNAIRPSTRRLVDDLCGLIAIPSVNPVDDAPTPQRREQEIADDLKTRLAALGLKVGERTIVEGRPNVWGVMEGSESGPSVMLVAHLDTVGVAGYAEPFSARVAEGRVHGRGACDMKAAIACYLETVRLLIENDIRLKGDLIIAGLCDEEHLMIGSKDMGANGPWANFGIIGEPTSLQICPAHKGQLGLVIRTFGKAVHSSMPEKGVNAIEHMCRVIGCLAEYDAELQARDNAHRLCGHGRFSMNVIKGGSVVSAVPDVCELEADRRILPEERLEDVIADVRRRIDDMASDIPDFSYEIAGPTLDISALDVPVESPLVKSLQTAVETVLGQPPVITAFPGGTDAPNLGFPCVICGPGHLEQAHSLNEFVEIDELVKATSIYLNAVIKCSGRVA